MGNTVYDHVWLIGTSYGSDRGWGTIALSLMSSFEADGPQCPLTGPPTSSSAWRVGDFGGICTGAPNYPYIPEPTVRK